MLEWNTYHVVAERNDNELGILGSLFNVRRNDRDLFFISMNSSSKGSR